MLQNLISFLSNIQNATYVASLVAMSWAAIVATILLIKVFIDHGKGIAVFIGVFISFFLIWNMLLCSVLYGMGYANQEFLDAMYNVSNGGLCLLVAVFLSMLLGKKTK